MWHLWNNEEKLLHVFSQNNEILFDISYSPQHRTIYISIIFHP